MMKMLVQYITDSFSLLENPIEDILVMKIVGALAFLVASGVVGRLYRSRDIDGRAAGSLLFWIIYLAVFSFVFLACATLIRVYNWMVGAPMYIWWLIGILIIFVLTVILGIKYTRKKKIIEMRCKYLSDE